MYDATATARVAFNVFFIFFFHFLRARRKHFHAHRRFYNSSQLRTHTHMHANTFINPHACACTPTTCTHAHKPPMTTQLNFQQKSMLSAIAIESTFELCMELRHTHVHGHTTHIYRSHMLVCECIICRSIERQLKCFRSVVVVAALHCIISICPININS